jgi:hypothetical protein
MFAVRINSLLLLSIAAWPGLTGAHTVRQFYMIDLRRSVTSVHRWRLKFDDGRLRRLEVFRLFHVVETLPFRCERASILSPLRFSTWLLTTRLIRICIPASWRCMAKRKSFSSSPPVSSPFHKPHGCHLLLNATHPLLHCRMGKLVLLDVLITGLNGLGVETGEQSAPLLSSLLAVSYAFQSYHIPALRSRRLLSCIMSRVQQRT